MILIYIRTPQYVCNPSYGLFCNIFPYTTSLLPWSPLSTTQHTHTLTQSLHKAIEYGPNDSAPSAVVGSYLLLISAISANPRRLDEAISLCNTALLSYPTFPKLYTTKASLLLKVNRTLAAANASESAIRINPGLASAHYYLGLARWRLSDLEAAEQAFRDALLLDKSSALLMLHLGVVLQNSGGRERLLEAEHL